jgi:Outer membrane protein beta-barrel domain
MKKFLSSGMLLFLLGTAAYSQTQFALGIKGGLNFANLDVSNSSAAYNSRTGYHAGAFLLVKLSKIGIQPEILFSRQGTSTKFNSSDLNANYDYINIPVILKFYTIGGLNIQVGPQIGFLAGANSDKPNFDLTGKLISITNTDIKDQVKGSDFSAALGLGWDAPFGLTIDARYNLGLTNVNNSGSNNDVKNQVIQVSLGFKLIKFGN